MMNELENNELSPYRIFHRDHWSSLRADTPLTLSEEEISRLQSLGDPISLNEVEEIYLPLSRLLSFYVEAVLNLHIASEQFLRTNDEKMPYIIGIAGSVAVGKSTTARILRELLSRWPSSPKVDLLTTDGFLYSNTLLEERGLMARKGFPESYDLPRLLQFLTKIKAGERNVTAPVYSHLSYDIVPNMVQTVDKPDIIILEGLNVLQTPVLPKDGKAVPFVSDFFDFSVYLDAETTHIREWYVERFMNMRFTRFTDPLSYFHHYANINEKEALEIANGLWEGINEKNLHENILPTRPRADLILHKAKNHTISSVGLRKL